MPACGARAEGACGRGRGARDARAALRVESALRVGAARLDPRPQRARLAGTGALTSVEARGRRRRHVVCLVARLPCRTSTIEN